MPPANETSWQWVEKFAWLPTRSSWSKKRIWLKTYWHGSRYYDSMGRPPIKFSEWTLIYTDQEYVLMLLRESGKQ